MVNSRYATDYKCPNCDRKLFAFYKMDKRLLCKKCNELFSDKEVFKGDDKNTVQS